MRIGIDASRAFVDNPTGTERYSYEVITRLLKLPEAKKHTWILYVRPQFLISNFKFLNNDQMFKCPNVQIREIPLSRLWTQVGLAARTWVDDLDVLWVPAHTLPVLRKPGIRTVVTVHGLEYEWLPEYENWLQRWYLPLSTKYAVMSASRIIAVSEFTKRQLVERLGADERKIAVIHEGVTRQRLETSVQRLVKGKYLLFVGTIQPRKNLVRLIEAFSRLDARRYTLNAPLTVAVQGFGNVGFNMAKFLHEQGFKVVAVSDSKGGIYVPEGLNPELTLQCKQKNGPPAGGLVGCYCVGTVCDLKKGKTISNPELLELPVDILVPAALENQITARNAGRIGAKLILEMANGPITPDADAILFKRGIGVIPDVLANSGGVTVSYFEWYQNLKNLHWSKEQVNKKLKKYMDKAFDGVWKTREKYKTDMRTAAFLFALEKIIKKVS